MPAWPRERSVVGASRTARLWSRANEQALLVYERTALGPVVAGFAIGELHAWIEREQPRAIARRVARTFIAELGDRP